MKYLINSLTAIAGACRVLVLIVVCVMSPASWTQTFVKVGEPFTQQGEKQEMKCGEHRIVLTCNHSKEIESRQIKYSRLCNDNKLEFIAKDGTTKKFGTYSKGRHKDKTPVEVFCRVPLSGMKFQVVVVTDNIGEIADSFITGLSEDGTQLIDEQGDDLNPSGYANFVVLPGYAAYWDEYRKSRPTSSRIAIKEVPPWQPKHQ